MDMYVSFSVLHLPHTHIFAVLRRIRLAIIQHIPLLAKQLGRDFFTDKLSSLCVGWLGDDISTIRQAAAKNLKDLTALFGSSWACEFLVPSIAEIRLHSSYLRRLTAVQACSMMSTVMEPDVAQTELLPMVLEMASDTVRGLFSCFQGSFCSKSSHFLF